MVSWLGVMLFTILVVVFGCEGERERDSVCSSSYAQALFFSLWRRYVCVVLALDKRNVPGP